MPKSTGGKEKEVEVLEIWMPCKEGGQVRDSKGNNLKLVAYIVNGYPVKLEKDFILERRLVPREVANNLIANSN